MAASARVRNPRVFVCHLSTDEDTVDVHRFTNYLRLQGIEADVDIYHYDNPPPNWAAWRDSTIAESDFVVLVLSRNLYDIVTSRHSSDQALQNCVISLGRDKAEQLLPVYLNRPVDESLVPLCLKGGSLYPITLNTAGIVSDRHFTAMYAKMTKQRIFDPPPIGPRSHLPHQSGMLL